METKKKLERSQDKVNQICDILRNEALEPAKMDAERIVEEAQLRANQIIQEAEENTKRMVEEARRDIEQERNVFQSSLAQASKQSIEFLRQSIENKLFNEEFASIIQKQSADPKIVANLINAICKAIEKEGLSSNIIASIPRDVSAEEVSKYLLEDVRQRLKDKGLSIGNFSGGVKVKFLDKQMTIDMSEEALRELLANYVRKDFRKLIFGTK